MYKQTFDDFVVTKYNECFNKQLFDEKQTNNQDIETVDKIIMNCKTPYPTTITKQMRENVAKWVINKYTNKSTSQLFKHWEHFVICNVHQIRNEK